jgi:hypothetical protein
MNMIFLAYTLSAQTASEESVSKSIRVHLYPSIQTGTNLYPVAGSSVDIGYHGAGVTCETYNYRFLNYLNMSAVWTLNSKYRMTGVRNTFIYFPSDRFQIKHIAGYSFIPKGYFSYTVDSFPDVQNPGRSTYYAKGDSLTSPDNFIHTGLHLQTSGHRINAGVSALGLFRNGFARRQMNAWQYSLYVEFFKNHRVGATVTGGILTNSLSGKGYYAEAEGTFRITRTTSVILNMYGGSTQFLYSHVDGGFMIYNEDLFRSSLGCKITQHISDRIELMVKAEIMRFRLNDTHAFYGGIKWSPKLF